MPYPPLTITLTPQEVALIAAALHESAEDREQFDEIDQAAQFAALHHKIVKAHDDLITH